MIEILHRYTKAGLYHDELAQSVRDAVIAAVASGADLTGADLSGADLSGAKGVNPWLSTPLRMLLDQPGLIRAYKLVNEYGKGPYHGGIKYEVGQAYEVAEADTDETHQCATGINLATLSWCAQSWRRGYRILVAEFTAADIAAIPNATDGKFRVHRCNIVGEVDLAERGIA